MFDNSAFPAPLEEEIFQNWLEEGREDNYRFRLMVVVWDAYDSNYKPIYVEELEDLNQFERYGKSSGREAMVAAYDLYSESKVV